MARRVEELAGLAKCVAAGHLANWCDGVTVAGFKTVRQAVDTFAGCGHVEVGQHCVHGGRNPGPQELPADRNGHHEMLAVGLAR